MNIENHTEKIYAEAIEDILNKIEAENSIHNMTWVAGQLGIGPPPLSRARNKENKGKKFARMTRKELLEKIAQIKGHHFNLHFDKNSSKIIVTPVIRKRLIGEKSESRSVYKVYYWRGGKMEIGVGIMIIAIKESKWYQATMLIDNQYPDFKDDDPYVLISTNINQYEKNTYVDFIDTALSASGHRQLAIFYTPSQDVKNLKIIEGVFATLTRQYKPIAGVMLMEELTKEEDEAFLDAEINDSEATYKHRRQFLLQIQAIPPIFYNALYRKRLDLQGYNLVSRKALPNYESWYHLHSFTGIYEGHHIRTTRGVVQCFLLEFHENGSTTLYFPRSMPGMPREPIAGQFKWVSQPKNMLTASFDYTPEEDHWRLRFILDGDDESGCLFGIFAGTDVKTGGPISGRVRLKLIQEVKSQGPRQIENYFGVLRQIPLFTEDYNKLLANDPGLEKFLNGHFKPDYTDWYKKPELTSAPNFQAKDSERELSISDRQSFMYAGDYDLYTLYRAKTGRTQKYYILRHPVRIGNDRTVQVKVGYQRTLSGIAMHKTPVLKINFSEDETTYSHILFTVNQLAYQKIDHVYGVLTGVHVEYHRSEATIAVLVGNHSIKAEVEKTAPRNINFDKSEFQEYEVGQKEFFELDSGDPAKIATFISGHFNRYISPPAHPNLEMQSRLSKYRLPYFKAACYSGLSYTNALKLIETTTSNQHELQENIRHEHSLFIDAMEESFMHGFCDPIPEQKYSSDKPRPEGDIGLLVQEMLPGGSMVNLVNDVLMLCDKWNRPMVRKAYTNYGNELPLK